MRCVLVGNYGVGNIGDEALKEYFLSEFQDVRWTVVSSRWSQEKCHAVPRLPFGLRSLFSPLAGHSCSSSGGWWRTISAIRHSDAIVFGGGSLFTDIESVWACMMWRAYVVLAAFFRVPVLLAFQGAGPWKTGLGLMLARKTFRYARFVSVRDAESLARIQSFGLRKPPVLTFDPAFALFASHPAATVPRRLVIIPRANSNDNFFAEVSRKLTGNFTDVRILLMQPDDAERRVGERVRALAGSTATVIELTSVQQFLGEVSSASEVLSQRYHGALAAFAMAIPVQVAAQEVGDKLDALNELVRSASSRDELLASVKRGADGLRSALLSVSSL